MTSHEATTSFRGYSGKKKPFSEKEDIEIINGVRITLSQSIGLWQTLRQPNDFEIDSDISLEEC
jgi:hypothetical protein